MVEVPVMAKTVQISDTSPYHRKVPLGGISFGPKNRCRKDVGCLELLEEEDVMTRLLLRITGCGRGA
eukprot:CAMPEP_0197825876 /NCGR_PEP_ID=MMETSP1437-20131217/2917_1 /TAXON_ID=49252 ORGANISM="Eucampia antarctica, Strain CCMP1452" /NCGR_SAMPLE_ID=MMETSP1437 /ASSEMBLY_ACC=CAM_ASM_001096 /LENGTH=66 /DNA_ID=CAMNT_0043426077 /DNA_START=351 /DNA_END=551 /DNA_ORIENTATION=-